ncbi:hypothetical protein BTVI_107566 [Pitangus sulphuratus]|nr:hypothetical protein BTVI_107566 [Pitangus sulphuratus]
MGPVLLNVVVDMDSGIHRPCRKLGSHTKLERKDAPRMHPEAPGQERRMINGKDGFDPLYSVQQMEILIDEKMAMTWHECYQLHQQQGDKQVEGADSSPLSSALVRHHLECWGPQHKDVEYRGDHDSDQRAEQPRVVQLGEASERPY